MKSGTDVGVIKARNKWVAADGTVVCTDERTLRFYNPGGASERLLDFEITIFASNGELTFGDTKEGTMAVRLAETMRQPKGKVGKGHIVNSDGVRDDADLGQARRSGATTTGRSRARRSASRFSTIPQNPRYPTWWHVRDYGLFAANPFGQHDFENLPDKTAGNLVVPGRQERDFPLSLLPARRRRAAGESGRDV